MKKLVAVMLTACLTFQTWMGAVVPVSGANINGAAAVTEQDPGSEVSSGDEKAPPAEESAGLQEEDKSPDNGGMILDEETGDEIAPIVNDAADSGKIPMAADNPTNELKVTLTAGLPFQKTKPMSANVTVTDKSGTSKTGSIAIDAVSAEAANEEDTGKSSGTVSFSGLAEGDAVVKITCDKFAPYTQTVTIKDHFTTYVNVNTAQINTDTKVAPGWMRIGDVNDDGEIHLNRDYKTDDERKEHSDEYKIIDAIRNNPDDVSCDLTGDGKVNIHDLHYLIQSRADEGSEKEPAMLMTAILNAPTISNKTKLVGDGDLADLLSDSGKSVQMQPTNEGTISEDNPVEFSFDMPDGGLEMGGIAIQAPAPKDEADPTGEKTTDLTAGTIRIDFVEDNENKTALCDINPPHNVEIVSTESLNSAAAYTKKDENPITAAFLNLSSAFMTIANAAPLAGSDVKVSVGADGSLMVDLGQQVAVKKVTITITGTKKKANLAEISKVEFVNDMDQRIPEPQMNIPKNITPEYDNESFTVSWDPETNVTGYEVEISGEVKKAPENPQTEVVRVTTTTHLVTKINDYSLMNFKMYNVRVRSVNGSWSSPWSDIIQVEPKPKDKPAPVDNVTVVGNYRSIKVTWKNMKDANRYMVEYKKSSEADYKTVIDNFSYAGDYGGGRCDPPANSLQGTTYEITGLDDNTKYNVRVRGWNEKGWGDPSGVESVTTRSVALPKLPNYYLFNTPQKDANGDPIVGALTDNIETVTRGKSNDLRSSDGKVNIRMVASPLDKEGEYTALGVVDNDYASYWSKYDWEDGVVYPDLYNKGLDFTFKETLETNYITFAEADQENLLSTVRVCYKGPSTGNEYKDVGATLLKREDENKRVYYIVNLLETIKATQIHLYVGRGSGSVELKVGEVHFHKNDGLRDQIWGLYHDRANGILKENLQEEDFQKIQDALEVRNNGELNPLHDELALELKTALKIWGGTLAEPIKVDNTITANQDKHLGFSGLNAWQPLGKVARAGETISIVVKHNSKYSGDSAALQLVYTQNFAQSDRLKGSIEDLKVGDNTFKIPATPNNNNEEDEQGGQLYIVYTGDSRSDEYTVRVEGGADISRLNLYRVEERKPVIEEYLKSLKNQVSNLETNHDAHAHSFIDNTSDYTYDPAKCILNTTDIMLEDMMYSVPATQVLEGLGGIESDSEISAKADKLDNALKAMEDAMTLFYQHKGLSNYGSKSKADRGNNALPSQHLNIRYMRMFAGAFMYASGDHIGIGYNETKLVSSAQKMDDFGWGIGHEIGHDINQGTYSIAEITNNYFAQLMTKADDTNNSTRWGDYAKVYEKVTSGAVGRSSNVGTQLALYWQLHLAFDDNPDRTVFTETEDSDKIFDNLFFARVDTYSRNPSKAPKEEIEPKLTGNLKGDGADQNIMRLACAAANGGKGENILPFFERWGMVPDDKTREYAAKFGDPTKKALYYVNDEARNYRVKNPESQASNKVVTGKSDVVSSVQTTAEANKATIEISANANYSGVILGYEIIRGMYSNGDIEKKVVGFQLADESGSATFVDHISSINNRVMYYEVKPVDKYLNYGAEKEAGSVKIQTDGVLTKNEWTVESKNLTSTDDIPIVHDANDPDNTEGNTAKETPKKLHTIDRVIDDGKPIEPDNGTVYKGTSSGSAEITIDMGKVEEVTSLKYQGENLGSVSVQVSEDGSKWTSVKENYKTVNNTDIIYFDSVEKDARTDWIGTYDARFVKLLIPQRGEISITEIDICGPTGDNVEFGTQDNQYDMLAGILQEDYVYDKINNYSIPKDSLVFIGTYKGNPAYNVVLLYDKEGNVIGSDGETVKLEQVIFAKVPEHGNLGETSDGKWVYYIPNERLDKVKNEIKNQGNQIRAELYRVDVAGTLEGERIVSDTKFQTINVDSLPFISLTDQHLPERQ